MKESLPSSEPSSVTREEIMKILQAKSKEDPVAIELLNRWIQNDEESARAKSSREILLCAVKGARLYAECGYKDRAIEELKYTMEAAFFEGDKEICTEIMDTISDIENS